MDFTILPGWILQVEMRNKGAWFAGCFWLQFATVFGIPHTYRRCQTTNRWAGFWHGKGVGGFFLLGKATSLCHFWKQGWGWDCWNLKVFGWKRCLASQDLHDDDMLSIIHLVSCIEEADLPFFMAIVLYISSLDLTRGWKEGWPEPRKVGNQNQYSTLGVAKKNALIIPCHLAV